MCESQTASNYTSDMDLPKFKLAGLRRVLDLLESLAVTESQKDRPAAGIFFRARRTGNGQNADWRQGVRGYGSLLFIF